MSWEPVRVIPITMASGDTLTSHVDLKHTFNKVRLVIPTFGSASDFFVKVCQTATGTYFRVAANAGPAMLSQNVQSHVVVATMSGATVTSEIDLGGYFGKVKLVLATYASAADIYVQAAESSGGTFRRISIVAPGTSSVQANDFRITSGTSHRMFEVPLEGFRFVKLEASTAPTDPWGLKFICSDPKNIPETDFKIGSNISSRVVEIPNGFRYVKIEASTANTAQINFQLICGG